MKSIKLKITYKTGATIEQVVNYIHFENNCLIYTLKKQVYCGTAQQIKIPLENVMTFDIEESEQQFN